MDRDTNLFSSFSPVSKEKWKSKAIDDLKGADFNKKLVWKTYEGFDIQPFYTREDLDVKTPITIGSAAGSGNKWINYIEIETDNELEANQKAVQAIQFDCRGLVFQLGGEIPDFNILLKDINPSEVSLSFRSNIPGALMDAYFLFLKKTNISLESISGFCDHDVLGKWMTSDVRIDFEETLKIMDLTREAPNFKGLHVHSSDFLNAGANYSQELAFTMNKVVDYVDQLSAQGVQAETVINNLSIEMGIGGDYFFEIAKIRVLRLLYRSVFEVYGVKAELPVISSTSRWSKSRYDYHVNLLRNTTEAMSAVIGGCDALLVHPHDSTYEEPTAFSHRVAANISNLLREESYLDKVEDPAAGSYYIETLTSQLFDSAIAVFKSVEENGGLKKSFERGEIQDQIKLVREKKETDMSTRKLVMVGTNKYPNLEENIDLNIQEYKSEASDGRKLLVPQRITRTFDQLRQKTHQVMADTGHRPKVFLACFGNLAMRKARAAFSSEFFGTAGFEILGEFFDHDLNSLISKSGDQEADIVIICASDQDYEDKALDFIHKFKSEYPDKKLILAGYPVELVESLKTAGLDDFIHVKTDVVAFLGKLQEEMLTTTK